MSRIITILLNYAVEIYETEKTYVNSLQLVQTEIILPLKALAQEGTQSVTILSMEEIREIFSYWDVILRVRNINPLNFKINL